MKLTTEQNVWKELKTISCDINRINKICILKVSDK